MPLLITVVEVNAAMQVQVVRAHRSQIRRALELYDGLIEELTAEIENDAGDLKNQAAILESLARSLARLVTLERQAYGVEYGEQPDEPSYEERMKALHASFADEIGRIPHDCSTVESVT